MMRIPLVAGNWKMNYTVEEARNLVYSMSSKLREISGIEKVLCPPFTSLVAVSALLEGSDIGLGAQNMHWEEKGAFTGEISPRMVREFCSYVILGHSERRSHFGETDENVNKKVQAAEKYDLTPIVCVGESLEQFESGQTREVVARQIRLGLSGVSPAFATRIVVAYEPIWAIGTGRASSGKNANDVVGKIIRHSLSELLGEPTSQVMRVLYGGSVTGANASEFFSQTEIDGALVGGASLKADEFVAISRAAIK
jgi:triosephosphate isomerase (TIM)